MSASTLTLASIVRHHAGSARAAVDLSLDVEAGELLAIVGASGAGKTTALRIVAGYEAPDAGRVLVDGADVTGAPPERRKIGMVFQHYALFPHLSVDENVAFGLAARGMARAARRERARQALADVGLAGTGSRAIHALSGGEQQRVALARALVIEPRVLLLDEPLSNLDPTLRIAMRDELRATLRAAHVTALFVTHDQHDAFAIGDRVALLDRGRLLQVGAPETLYDRPASRAVAEFIGRATLVPAERDGDSAIVRVAGVARRVAAAAARDEASGWLAVLRPEALMLDAVDAADAWPGRVVTRRFAGGETICHVELAPDVVVELASRERTLREGDRVGVRPTGVVALVPADDR